LVVWIRNFSNLGALELLYRFSIVLLKSLRLFKLLVLEKFQVTEPFAVSDLFVTRKNIFFSPRNVARRHGRPIRGQWIIPKDPKMKPGFWWLKPYYGRAQEDRAVFCSVTFHNMRTITENMYQHARKLMYCKKFET
jgi:hypothetical protein